MSMCAPPRNMRSNSVGGVRLNQPISYNKPYGERAFSVSASRLLNSLPLELRLIRSYSRFKFNLKTQLFIIKSSYYLHTIFVLYLISINKTAKDA